MKRLIVILLLLSACQHAQQPLEERVADVPGEVLYHDVLMDMVPADKLVVFGISLGDSEEYILKLHGEPDISEDYEFGRQRNLEYKLGMQNTAVLYHLEKGVVTGILLSSDANPLLKEETVLDHNLSEVFGLLGVPTRVQHLHLEQAYFFDELGYEVYMKKKQTDRIYFKMPIVIEKDEGCAQVITYARDPATDECYELPNPCVVPQEWDVVESCSDNSAPIIVFE